MVAMDVLQVEKNKRAVATGFFGMWGQKRMGLGKIIRNTKMSNITHMMPRISMQQEDSEETCN